MAVKCSNRTLWTTADEDGYPYWVEFEDRPFTKGNSKFMYKGRLNGKGPRSGDYCTLKVFRTIDIAEQEDWSLYINRVERANKLASQFNKLIDNQHKLKFLIPMTALVDISSTCTDCIYFLSNTKRIRSDDCVAVEPYIGHKFRKFYRNSPLKGAEYAYILQAFSHFTASQTGDTLICGLQGVAVEDEFILTNPIIHSANQDWGPKDQGPQGFRKFFTAHTCNDICRTMDLPEYLETMSVTEEIDKDIEASTSKQSLDAPIVSEQVSQVAQVDPESVPLAESSVDMKDAPSILQTPPMSRVGRTIIAPVSVEVSASRTSSVTGPPEFAEDIPGESLSRPFAESEILDATPIDDIAPPPSSEYTPCQTVEEYLELKKSIASFSAASEAIPMIDDELACAESEMRDILPPSTDDFEPTISPSIDSYMKDKESLEIIPHGSQDLDSESQPSISVFEDNVPAGADLGSMNNFQETPRESVTRDAEVFESLENTPCGTMSQESLVTTPCGSIRQEIDSQPSVDSTPKDSVSQDLIPVSEPPLDKAALHLDLQECPEGPHDIESQVCLVSIPPDCMDHHLDTLESLEALSPASEKLRSVSLGEECVEPGVVEEQVGAQEFSETETTQEASTEGLDNVEVEVHKSECEDGMSSDFKQSLETIPEGSTESDLAHSDENEVPETSTVVEGENVADDVAGAQVETTDASGQEETVAETTSESGPTAEAVASEEAVVDSASEPVEEAVVADETATETAAEPCGEAAVSEETAVETAAEPCGEAAVAEDTAVETTEEPCGGVAVADEITAEPTEEAAIAEETSAETAAEPCAEAAISQETAVETAAEPCGEAAVPEETPVETTGEAAVAEEAAVESAAEPVEEAAVAEETAAETAAEPCAGVAFPDEITAEPAEEAPVTEVTPAEPCAEAPVTEEETTAETAAEPCAEAPVVEETTVATNAEPCGEAPISQETAVETAAEPVGETAVPQEEAVESQVESDAIQEEPAMGISAEDRIGECRASQEIAEPTAQEETPMGDANKSQDTVTEPTEEEEAKEAIIETTGVSSQDLVVESMNEMPGESDPGNVVEPSSDQTTGEGDDVCPDSGSGLGSNAAEVIDGGNVGQESDPTGEVTGDDYTCQDSGFGSFVDTTPIGYSNRDPNNTMTYDSDPSSNTYPPQSYTPVTSSYPTNAINTITSHSPNPYYGVPPEYRINESCDASRCEPGCPQRYTKMTIVPDLDTMEYVETKRLDPVYEEENVNQQGIETLPRRVNYYLEPQESHEIITFRINISPEVPRPEQKSDDYDYQNVGGTSRQCSNQGDSSRYCSNCQPRETPEIVSETSVPGSERSASFYSYHLNDNGDCSESMPQRSC